MVTGKITKCFFKSPCGKLVGVVHSDDILLAGPRSHVGAVRKSPRKRHETREQNMETRPTDASEIVMLNRRAQWTLDPQHVKGIIDLEEAKSADTQRL